MSTGDPRVGDRLPPQHPKSGRLSRAVAGAVVLSLFMIGAGIGIGAAVWSGGSTSTPAAAQNSAPPSPAVSATPIANVPSGVNALPKGPNGAVGNYPVGLMVTWVTSRGDARFTYTGGNCTNDEFNGTIPASGVRTIGHAFTAKQSGWCYFEPSTANWRVSTSSGASGTVSVAQTGPGLYFAGCGGGLTCPQVSPFPSFLPSIRVS